MLLVEEGKVHAIKICYCCFSLVFCYKQYNDNDDAQCTKAYAVYLKLAFLVIFTRNRIANKTTANKYITINEELYLPSCLLENAQYQTNQVLF